MFENLGNLRRISADIGHFRENCRTKNLKKTISRLCVYLRCSRLELKKFLRCDCSMFENSDEAREAQVALSYVLQECECWLEDALFCKETVQGAKFSLQNNFNWCEKQQQEIKQDTTIEVVWGGDSALNQGKPMEIATPAALLEESDQSDDLEAPYFDSEPQKEVCPIDYKGGHLGSLGAASRSPFTSIDVDDDDGEDDDLVSLDDELTKLLS